MKLYVVNKYNTSEKIYLNVTASTRNELARVIGDKTFYLNGILYSVWEVYAEGDTNSTGAGAVIGGLVGLLGGPVGMIIGGVVGGAIGNSSDQDEVKNINLFNNS
jgi:hypothetical protein